MKFAALISGGKDSIFNILECLNQGHELIALLNLYPSSKCGKDEIDSYMYQSVGHETIHYISEAIGNVPLYRSEITGVPLSTDLEYICQNNNSNDEVEDLFKLISTVKQDFPTLEGISSGAILSNYQRSRVENICSRLKLTSLAFMWQRSQIELLQSILRCKVSPILIKIAALGLDGKKHLGKPLELIASDIISKSNQFGLNPCGEGGEYETLTLDAPFFQKRLEIDSNHIVTLVEDDMAAVKYLKIDSMRLIEKQPHEYRSYDTLYGSDFRAKLNLAVQTDVDCLRDDIRSEINEIVDQIILLNSETTRTEIQLKILTACAVISDEKQLENSTVKAVKYAVENIKLQISELADDTELDWVYSLLCVPNIALLSVILTEYGRSFTIDTLPGLNCVETVELAVVMHVILVPRKLAVRSNMYFRSLSHWVPACIGPYSQAVGLRSREDDSDSYCLISGQVAMHPENLHMLIHHGTDIGLEALLGLRHVTRLAWTHCQLSWIHLHSMICYCITENALAQCRFAFHDAVCAMLCKSGMGCVCERILFVTVHALPHQARVQWQALFSSSLKNAPFENSGAVITFSTDTVVKLQYPLPTVKIDAYLEGDYVKRGSIAISL